MALIACKECNNQMSDKADSCPKCGCPNPKKKNNHVQTIGIDLTGLDAFYKDDFTKIYESKETYKGRWNWYAFFFNWIWLMYKKMWGYGFLLLLINALYNYFFSIGVANFTMLVGYHVGIAFTLGKYGNKIYYNHLKSIRFKNR